MPFFYMVGLLALLTNSLYSLLRHAGKSTGSLPSHWTLAQILATSCWKEHWIYPFSLDSSPDLEPHFCEEHWVFSFFIDPSSDSGPLMLEGALGPFLLSEP